MILVIFFSGIGTNFYRTAEGLILLTLIAIFINFRGGFKLSKNIYYALAIWTVYIILLYWKFGEYHPYFAIIIPCKIFIAFVLIRKFQYWFFEKFETIIYYLCYISLFFYVWQMVSPYTLFQVFSLINVDGAFGNKYFFVYYFQSGSVSYNWIDFRNCGFCAEPSQFSFYIIIAMFLNFARTKFAIKGNKYFWIFLLAIITTKSTTAFATLAIVSIWFVFNNRTTKKALIFALPLIITFFIISFINLPFLSEKINSSLEYVDYIDSKVAYLSTIEQKEGTEYEWAPQRFESFVIDWIDFINNPVLGYGGHMEARWTQQLGAVVGSISGLGGILARYGLFGVSFLLLMLIKSGKALQKIYKFKYSLFWGAIMLSLIFGLDIIGESPITFLFYIFPFFIGESLIQNSQKYGLSIK